MAFEHERIHLETSSVLIGELPLDLVKKPEDWPDYFREIDFLEQKAQPDINYKENQFTRVGSSSVQLGKPNAWPTFGWDNEYGVDQREVESFEATKFLISNGEFFQFVEAGGYENSKYWSEKVGAGENLGM